MIAVVGRNYGPCQGVIAATLSPTACETASTAHWGGLIALVAGGVILLASLVSLLRR
jgi:hypothetical protein